MPKGKPKAKINKSEWIRQQPAALTARELVDKAKKEGIELSLAMVYTVRSGTKNKGSEVVKGKPGRKPKAAAAAAPEEKVNKSAWIRQQPIGLAAKDVVEKAKNEGITLTIQQVYTARSTGKTNGTPVAAKAANKPGPKPKNGTAAAAAPKASPAKSAARAEFARYALILGTEQSQEVLDRIVSAGLAV